MPLALRIVPLFTALLLSLLVLPVACSGSDTPTDTPGSDSTTPTPINTAAATVRAEPTHTPATVRAEPRFGPTHTTPTQL